MATDLSKYTLDSIPEEVQALFRLCGIKWSCRLADFTWVLQTVPDERGIVAHGVIAYELFDSLELCQHAVAELLASRAAYPTPT